MLPLFKVWFIVPDFRLGAESKPVWNHRKRERKIGGGRYIGYVHLLELSVQIINNK